VIYSITLPDSSLQPIRVTPEAYYLFDAAAVGVPELCDAFKVRYAWKNSRTRSFAHSLIDTFTNLKIWQQRVERLRLALGCVHLLELVVPHQDICLFAKLVEHLTLMVGVLKRLSSQIFLQVSRLPNTLALDIRHHLIDRLFSLGKPHLTHLI